MIEKKTRVLSKVDRINELEVALTAFNSKRSLYLESSNLRVEKIGSTALLIDPSVPESIYYNRIKGFGQRDLEKIDEILAIYSNETITPCFDMTPDCINMEVGQALMNRGFVCGEQLAFLELAFLEKTSGNEKLEIVKVTDKDADTFVDLIAKSDGKEVQADLKHAKAKYFAQPDFHNYVAYLEGEPVGMGSMFIKGMEGYLANDYTFPSARGNGVQKALVKHRINAAKELGLQQLYTDVEFGTISHDNMLKCGFNTVFTNSFWLHATD